MAAFHGKNGLIYVSGSAISTANAWTLNITQDSVEVPQFGDGWKNRVTGMKDWSGSITAWMDLTTKILTNAATAGVPVSLMIYPDRTSASDYFSGSAIFGAGMSAGVTAAADRSGDFVGNGTLTITGFS